MVHFSTCRVVASLIDGLRGVLACVAWGVAVTLLAVVAAAAEPAPAKPRNIVFFFADDQRPDTIAALGNRHIRTPNIDRLVNSGVAFRRAYLAGCNNGAVCMPSRAMLMTGQSEVTLGSQIPDDAPLMPVELGKAGFDCFATGKWHNGVPSMLRGFASGKSVFFGGMGSHVKLKVSDVADHQITQTRQQTQYSSEAFADAAIEFLRAHKGEKPFFVYLAFTAPHDPRLIPPGYESKYSPAQVPLPANFMPKHPFDNGELVIRDERLLPIPRNPESVKREIAVHYAMVEHLDAQVGRVLQTLEEIGHADDTLVIFAADNGLALGSHGLLGKQNVYEHSMGVPLVFSGPGVVKGKVTDAMTYLYDIFPTVCDLIGAAIPQQVEGKSLINVLTGKSDTHRDVLYLHYRDLQRSVSDGRFKLIRYTVKGVTTEQLFDLRDDPAELKNLIDDPQHAATRARLTPMLEEYQRRVTEAYAKAPPKR